jgi:non-heme chloroperoxidase
VVDRNNSSRRSTPFGPGGGFYIEIALVALENAELTFFPPRLIPLVNTTFDTNSVVLPGRCELPYVEQGNPTGVPLVLLHGLTDSWRSFEPVLPYLPEHIHAFALTQRGHGDSVCPAATYRTRDFAADVAAFLKSLGLGPAIVVGHSMGSTNALRFAIDFPDLTRGLVLVGSFATYKRNPVVKELWDSVAQLTDPIEPAFALEFQKSTLARAIPPAFLEAVVQESLKVPAHVWRAALEGLMEDDFVSEVGRIKAPTRIVWGDRDAFCPRRDQETFLETIHGSKLSVYEEAGHALHWEDPAHFAADLVEFVNSLPAPIEPRRRAAAVIR